MQTPSRVVIFLSMIVLAEAVAQNVWAFDSPGAPAAAEEEDETEAADSPSSKPARDPIQPAPADQAATPAFWGRPAEVSHARQFGLSLTPGTGYRIVVPYKEDIQCGDANGNTSKRVCTHTLPFFLELQLSYGIYSRLDFLVDLRFAVQKDPATKNSHQFALAPGFRYWLDQDVRLKFYATGQIVYDYTDYIQVAKSDVGIRNVDGVMFDAIRNVGFFFQVGWTMGFSRWYRMELDAGLGVQLRFP
jgi:hypothetical protein